MSLPSTMNDEYTFEVEEESAITLSMRSNYSRSSIGSSSSSSVSSSSSSSSSMSSPRTKIKTRSSSMQRRKRQEKKLRQWSEIEELVKEVVPADEFQDMKGLIKLFGGNEDSLKSTLLSMKERSEKQRNRLGLRARLGTTYNNSNK